MEITVKNVKIAQFASEETLCFEATVYIDGKRTFVASNDGRGGCNRYRGDRSAISAAEDWAKTQPPVVCPDPMHPDDPNKSFTYQPDLDHFVGEAVDRHGLGKEARKILKKFAIVTTDGKICTWPGTPDRDTVAKKYPGCRVLNDLPLAEVIEILDKIQ